MTIYNNNVLGMTLKGQGVGLIVHQRLFEGVIGGPTPSLPGLA